MADSTFNAEAEKKTLATKVENISSLQPRVEVALEQAQTATTAARTNLDRVRNVVSTQ